MVERNKGEVQKVNLCRNELIDYALSIIDTYFSAILEKLEVE